MRHQSAHLGPICDAAIALFDRDGFDAVTLEQVSTVVGISTESLRLYFPDIAALYAQAFREAVRIESIYLRAAFEAEVNGQAVGTFYCELLPSRFADSADLRFLLRAAYAPPPSLRLGIASRFAGFIDDIVGEYRKAGEHGADRERPDAAVLEMRYLDAVESVFLQLVDGGAGVATARASTARHPLAYHTVLSGSSTLAASG
jgi:AcrR family transcriptional regulator